MRNMIKTSIILLATALLPAPAISQTESGGQKLYAGLSAGVASFGTECVGCDNAGSAFTAALGYRFDEMFAGEAGVLYASGFEAGGIAVTAANAFLGGIVNFPLSGNLSFSAKFGMHFWEVEGAAGVGNVIVRASVDGNDPYFGVGMHYMINPKTSLGGEFTRYNMENSDGENTELDVLGLSVVFSF